MTNKKILLGMAVLILAFGVVLLGCPVEPDNNGGGPNTPQEDTWSNVTSLTQMNGTWKGTQTEVDTETLAEYGLTMTNVMEMTMTINATSANAGTMSGSMKITMTFSGAGLNEAWEFIKAFAFDEEEGWSVNDTTHSGTMTQSMGPINLTLSDTEGMQINQNATKLKIPASEDSSETILTKQ